MQISMLEIFVGGMDNLSAQSTVKRLVSVRALLIGPYESVQVSSRDIVLVRVPGFPMIFPRGYRLVCSFASSGAGVNRPMLCHMAGPFAKSLKFLADVKTVRLQADVRLQVIVNMFSNFISACYAIRTCSRVLHTPSLVGVPTRLPNCNMGSQMAHHRTVWAGRECACVSSPYPKGMIRV